MYKTELYHHGILGQKWGVRRFQNYDGTLTAKGKKQKELKTARQYKRALNDVAQGITEQQYYAKRAKEALDRAHAKTQSRSQQLKKLHEKYGIKDDHPLTPKNSKDFYGEHKDAYKAERKLKEAVVNELIAKGKAEREANDVKAGERLAKRLIKDANEKGFTVTSKKAKRLANSGEAFAAQVLGGFVGQISVAIYEQGDYYKVQ